MIADLPPPATPDPAEVVGRLCTCHEDDRPTAACQERYAASECQAAAALSLVGRLEELQAKATPGEWNHLGYCGQDGVIQGPRQIPIATFISGKTSGETGHQSFDNAALTVAMKNALPALFALIQQQQARIAEVWEACAKIADKLASEREAKLRLLHPVDARPMWPEVHAYKHAATAIRTQAPGVAEDWQARAKAAEARIAEVERAGLDATISFTRTERRALAAEQRAKALVEAASQARDQFAFYAREHTAAGKVEKAATNQRFADMLGLALAERT